MQSVSLFETIKHSPVPSHIGIIMDGNGRWAQKRNLPRTAGHRQGLETAKTVVGAAAKLGVKYVTLYTFSTENWKRAQEEVGFLMNLIQVHLRAEFEFYKKNSIRILHTGNLEGLSETVRSEIARAMQETAAFSGLSVVLAINYGGRDEIMRAMQRCVEQQIMPSEAEFSRFFDIPELPDVDLLIRTGGEKRLSNFLLWHAAYAELAFCDTLWPDYTEEDFYRAVADYTGRNRRFGGVNE